MDNAMTNNNRATEIADYVVDLEERIKLWKDLMAQKTGQPIAVVESNFEDRLGKRYLERSLSAQERHANLLQRLQSANEDKDCALMTILHEGIFRRSPPVYALAKE